MCNKFKVDDIVIVDDINDPTYGCTGKVIEYYGNNHLIVIELLTLTDAVSDPFKVGDTDCYRVRHLKLYDPLSEVTHYTFKERITDVDGDGSEHLITPHDNPHEFESPIDFIWDSVELAREWLVNEAEDWGIEKEESDKWVLVKVTTEIVK